MPVKSPVTLKELAAYPQMARWFNPILLLKLLRNVIVSTMFGQYADRRLIVAALDTVPFPPRFPNLSGVRSANSGPGFARVANFKKPTSTKAGCSGMMRSHQDRKHGQISRHRGGRRFGYSGTS